MANLGATEQRWVAQLANYNYVVKYRPGAKNGNADALSRLPEEARVTAVQTGPETQLPSDDIPLGPTDASEAVPTAAPPSQWRDAQQADPDLQQLYDWKRLNSLPPKEARSTLTRPVQRLLADWAPIEIRDGVLVRQTKEPGTGMDVHRVLVPGGKAQGLWAQYHRASGHASSERTLSLIRRRFYWPGMVTDSNAWAKDCVECAISKAGPEVRAPLQSNQCTYPFEIVGLDYLSLGRPADTYPYILVKALWGDRKSTRLNSSHL